MTSTSLEQKMKHYTAITTILLFVFLIGYLLSPNKAAFLGLIIGLSFSYLSLWTTYRKAQLIGTVTVKKTEFLSYFVTVFGMVIRIGLAICSVWIALRFPEKVSVILVIAGFALIYVIIMTDMLVQFVRKR